jgi:hypothetical protein
MNDYFALFDLFYPSYILFKRLFMGLHECGRIFVVDLYITLFKISDF